jgi:hypothetical protein
MINSKKNHPQIIQIIHMEKKKYKVHQDNIGEYVFTDSIISNVMIGKKNKRIQQQFRSIVK